MYINQQGKPVLDNADLDVFSGILESYSVDQLKLDSWLDPKGIVGSIARMYGAICSSQGIISDYKNLEKLGDEPAFT